MNALTPAERRFARGIYQEHLEEAAAVYALRQTLTREPGRPWHAATDLERRLAVNLAALEPGVPLIDDLLEAAFENGEPSEVFAATALWCALERHDRLAAAMAADQEEADRVAFSEALCYFARPSFQAALQKALNADQLPAVAVAAQVVGFRRFPCQVTLSADDTQAPVWKAWALGRLQGPVAEIAPAAEHLDRCRDAQAAVFALSLLRRGRSAVLAQVRARLGEASWPALVLAIAGEAADVARLVLQCHQQPATPETTLALGLLGDPSAVRTLLNVLDRTEQDAVAEAAALALFLITGADLDEQVFVDEPMENDEHWDTTIAAENATPGLARALRTYTRVAQDGDVWRNWWANNGSRFESGRRYRRGALLHPRLLVADLTDTLLPPSQRTLIYEALVVRYQCPVPFEATLFCMQQRTLLTQMAAWAESKEPTWQAGAWYRQGQTV